jgi:tRNA(fMet)-specific endonuclease VapC
MTRYILDTDTISLYQRGNNASIKKRLEDTPPEAIAVTVITVEEQMRGRLAQIKKANSASALGVAYRWLRETTQLLGELPIMDFDKAAIRVDEQLRQQKPRLGTQDRRIAAIALAHNCIVVTRNQADFGQIIGLTLEDWSK